MNAVAVAILLSMSGLEWSVIDRRVLDVIDRLDGRSAAIASGEIIAAGSERQPRFPGDTIYVSVDLHDSTPAVIERIDTVADGLVYHLVDNLDDQFCVGRKTSCFVELTDKKSNSVEDALLERLLSTHAHCLALASTYVLIDRMLTEELLTSQVIVHFRDGRYAHMYEREGKVRFDSVIVKELGVATTGIELFTVYKTDAAWPKNVHILDEKVKLTTKTDRSRNLRIETAVYSSNDSTFVMHTFYRQADWDTDDIMLQTISEQRTLIVKGRVVAGSFERSDVPDAPAYPMTEAALLRLVH